jgi:hypothetical protein
VLVATPPTLSRFVRRADDMLLGREIVDHEVIDLRVPRVVRVNDVLLDVSPAGWQVAGVDIGVPALLRRLLPRPLRRDIDTAAHLLRWDDLDLLARLVPDGVLPADHRRLASISPADLAGIAAAVPPRQAAALIATLDDARAAATLAELCAERRAAVLAMLNSARIPRILEHTAPVAAAAAPAPLPSTARP